MAKLCKRCGNLNMKVKFKLITKDLSNGKTCKITGCGECVIAVILNAHEHAKKYNPDSAERVEKMAREIDNE